MPGYLVPSIVPSVGSIVSGLVASGSLGNVQIASGGLGSGAIGSGQLGTNHLGSGAINGALSNYGGSIATRSVLDQTTINSGVLFTTQVPGLYRVNGHAEITQGGLLNAGTLSLTLGWTSDSQIQTLSPITGLVLLTSGAFSQSSTVLRAVSGTNIYMSVSLSSLTGTPHYNAYGSVERLF